MPITRNPQNLYEVVEWTDEINDLDRQYKLVRDNTFEQRETTQKSIIFDKDERTTTLLASQNRGSRASSYNQERVYDTVALALTYFKHSDYLLPEDIQSVRMKGTPDGAQKIEVAKANKIEQMRRDYDQSMEYMKFRCITQGKTITPDGQVFADMFTEFGATQVNVTWDLTDTDFDLSKEMRKIQRLVRDGLKNGGVMQEPDIYLEASDYDAVLAHDNVKEAYKFYSANPQPLRDDIIMGFRHAGVTMMPLDGSFTLPSGSTEAIMTAGTGYAVPKTGPYVQWSGPSNKLAGANGGAVADLYLYEYADVRDENIEFQLEAAPLFVHTKPLSSIKITVTTA